MRDYHSNSAYDIKCYRTDDTQLYLADCLEKQATARHKEDLWAAQHKREHILELETDKFLLISVLKM